MIQSIKFLNPASVQLPERVRAGYEFNLPSLRGRTFEFTSGLNIVVGSNGSGKTSLLNVLRVITCCKGQFGSDVCGHSYWALHLDNLYNQGYWHLAEVESPYRRATINLRKFEDIEHGDEISSSASFTQGLIREQRSNGEQVTSALHMMTEYLKDGKKAFYNDKECAGQEKKLEHLSFEKMVLDAIEKEIAKCNDLYKRMFADLLDYYTKQKTDTKEGQEGEKLTLLMDEPDSGLDIDNVNDLYDFLMSIPDDTYQTIAVLHNIGMIHKLKKSGKANFIELSEGYVDKVEEFYK